MFLERQQRVLGYCGAGGAFSEEDKELQRPCHPHLQVEVVIVYHDVDETQDGVK
jgi:hypothetical protein